MKTAILRLLLEEVDAYSRISAGLCLIGISLAGFALPVNADNTAVTGHSGSTWKSVATPNTDPNQENELNGVACPSPTECWAVGYYNNGSQSQTLIEHWNGSQWSIHPSPNTSANDSNFLEDVACNSATDCWAAGYYLSGATSPIYNTLIEHFDGNSWTITSSPNVLQAQENYLQGLTCNSSHDCWAVGFSSSGNPNLGVEQGTQTLIEHWNGTAWSIVQSPNTSLLDVDILHEVTCSSSAECWAVGWSSNSQSGVQTLVQRYDGTSWTIVSSPSPSPAARNVLLGVACTAVNDCWATGYEEEATYQTLVLHFDGTQWNLANPPSPVTGRSDFTFGVACQAGFSCWSVGSYSFGGGSVGPTLFNHFNSLDWHNVPSDDVPANEGEPSDVLYRVTCNGPHCVAVGYYFNSSAVPQTLIEQHDSIEPPVKSFVSRKQHGAAGTFDIDLTKTYLVECRSGGPNGEYQLVLTFDNSLAAVNTATVTGGIGTITSSAISTIDTHQYVVNLTGVANAQSLTVSLGPVVDSEDNVGTASFAMGVLVGDVNGSGLVDSGDVFLVRQQTGQAVSSSNFREDVNATGVIDSGDVFTTRQQTSTAVH